MNANLRHAVLFVAIAALAGCNPAATTGPTPQGKATSTGVTLGSPKKKDLRRVIEQPATIEAFEETPLVARIPGYIGKISADRGTVIQGPKVDAKGALVRPGDVLAEQSVPDMLQELAQKKALVELARAEVDQTAASLEAAEAAIGTARAQVREAESGRARAGASYDYWKTQYLRYAEAVKDRVIEKQVYEEAFNKFKAADAYKDEIEAKVQSAQAQTKESEAKQKKAKADVEAARARVRVAEAEEGRLAALAEYRFIRAPYDGVVTRRNFNTGHFLQPGSGDASVLFVVARTDTLRISADIPEAEAAFITKDLLADIEPPFLKDQSFKGKVARTSWALDGKSRTLRIEIDHPNKDGKLRPGTYANVLFTIAFDGRWTLPASAIFTHADQPCCWLVDKDRKTVRTPLKLGVRDAKDVEIVKMQASDGKWAEVTGEEEVVVTNLGAVSEGKEVPVKGK